jgi:hypothetical protein
MIVHTLILGSALIYLAAIVGSIPGESDTFGVLFLIAILGLVMAVWVIVYLWLLARSLRKERYQARSVKATWLAIAAGVVLVWCTNWFSLHPSHIHYKFDYGQTGGWQEVQFSYAKDGVEIEGPWVGGFPLRVSFPDLNHDGFPDIRVVETAGYGAGGVVEYIYLPQNDGEKLWHLVRHDSGLNVSYSPDGQSFP